MGTLAKKVPNESERKPSAYLTQNVSKRSIAEYIKVHTTYYDEKNSIYRFYSRVLPLRTILSEWCLELTSAQSWARDYSKVFQAYGYGGGVQW